MTDATFEPGWLMRAVHEAHISVMAGTSPGAVRRAGLKAETPISQAEARDLYQAMDTRFKQWTGMSLAEFNTRESS